jgi:C1A family cysteine protease
MRAVLVLALAVAASAALAPLKESEYQFLFTRWVGQFEKKYTADQFFAKYNTFKNALEFIRNENMKNHSYELGMNQFGDLTAEEFKAQVVGGCYQSEKTRVGTDPIAPAAGLDDIDWRKKGAVTDIKNQAQCGSCWAFSATGALEGAWYNAKQQLVNFSEQQLVDCSGSEGNMGCNGGLMDYAFSYWMKKGACTEDAYPYTARDGSCKQCTPVGTVSKFVDVKANDENALGDALKTGPVSVAIEADQAVFQYYKSGVIESGCGRNLDHGVLLVGYAGNPSPTAGYWIVKNSWGKSWGAQGYVNIRAFKNMCGIATENSYPVV